MPVMVAAALEVTAEQRSELERMARSSSLPHRAVVQAGGLLLAAVGVANNEIARRCDTTADAVRRWRAKFNAGGIATVGKVAPGRGRKSHLRRSVAEAIVDDTLHTVPDDASTDGAGCSRVGDSGVCPWAPGRASIGHSKPRTLSSVQERAKQVDNVIDAARTVAGDLEHVLAVLEKVHRKSGARMRPRDQDRLRRAINRVDACQRLLNDELDQLTPDRRFLRLAMRAAVASASLAVGLVGNELSQAYDLQVPIVQAEQAADHAGEAVASVRDGDLSSDGTWQVRAEDGWWAPMVNLGLPVTAMVAAEVGDDDGDMSVMVELRFPEREQLPPIHLTWWPRAEPSSLDAEAVVVEGIKVLARQAPEGYEDLVLQARLSDDFRVLTLVTVERYI